MGTLAVKNFPEQHCPHLLAQLSDKPNFRHVTQELVVIGCSHVTSTRVRTPLEEALHATLPTKLVWLAGGRQ